jgi:hypothetical protein
LQSGRHDLDDAAMPVRPLAAALLTTTCALVPATAQEEVLQPFRNQGESFQLQLPTGWRQLSPNEARRLGENPAAPAALTLAQPRAFYAVGPVDAWLAGDFRGPWLYVVEQDSEWHLDDDYAEVLRASWREKGAASGERHELAEIDRRPVGSQQVEAVVAIRHCTPPPPRPASTCLDVHAPAGGQQITLSFQCPPDAFAAWQPRFRRYLDTLTFARPSRKAKGLQDRLWTPLITGAVVSVVLFGLYKHTRGRR